MSLKPVLESLEEIANTPSTNDKVQLLKEYLQDKDFLKVVKYALSGDLMFGIKKLPTPRKTLLGKKANVWGILRRLSQKPGATDADKMELAFAASIDKETTEVVKRIVTKDLKCGASAKLVNKARPGTVNTVPYMRCSTDKKLKNITYPAIIQEKADGMFVNLMINKSGKIKIITRNGKTVHQLEFLKKVIREGRGLPKKTSGKTGKTELTTHYGIMKSRFSDNYRSMVYTGELLVRKKGKILPRKTGNGILGACIHGTAPPEDADCVIFKCWDCLPLKAFYEGHHEIAYNTRIFDTSSFTQAVNDPEFVDKVMTKRVDSYEEAHEFYGEIREAGGEGAILKNLDSEWKDHTSPNQIKMKNVSEAELEIVGWEPGKEGSKYELCMGAVKYKSKEGALRVSVGTGFSDDEREADWDMAIGEISSIEYESVIQDKRNPEAYSLFLPRFKEGREDRDVPDTIQDILER